MRKIVNISFLLTFLICVCACVPNYEDRMVGLLKEELGGTMVDYDTILVIPGSGCPGCISAAERWVRDHVDDDGLLIVFTGIVSRKTLLGRLRHYGIDPEQKKSIRMDAENTFYLENYVQCSYPYAFRVDNGEVIEVKAFQEYVKE